jgi:hypothetical protein
VATPTRGKIKFVVALCDPAERLESAFSYYKQLDVPSDPVEDLYTNGYSTFADWLTAVLREYPAESAPGGVLSGWGCTS